MSRNDNQVVFIVLAIATTFSLSMAAIWLINPVEFGAKLGGENKSENKPANTSELTLLGDTFSAYSTFRSSAFQQAVKEVGITLRYTSEFNQAKRAERLNNGEADLLVTTLDQFLKQKPQGKIVGLIDTTVGADAVVLNTKKYPNLKSLMDLNQLVAQAKKKGQQLGITFAGDTPSEYLALVLSTKFSAFKLSDFQVNKVADAYSAWKLLQSDQNVAVAVVWEPYVTQARRNGYSVVLSSKDVPGVIVDVIVASNRLIESQPEKISKLLIAYYSRIDAIFLDASQLQAQIADDGKLSPLDAAAVIQGIDFFTCLQAQDWLRNDTLEKRINSTAAVLSLSDKLNQVPQNPQELFSSQFIAQAAEHSQTLIGMVGADNPELADRLSIKRKAIVPTRTPNQITTAPNIGNLQMYKEVEFAEGSAVLTDEGKKILNQLAEEIAKFNEQTVAIRVIGHTSSSGSADFNTTLSQQRAQVVVNYLRSRGLKHNIVAEGQGSREPLPGISPENPRNQRTEIRLVRLK